MAIGNLFNYSAPNAPNAGNNYWYTPLLDKFNSVGNWLSRPANAAMIANIGAQLSDMGADRIVYPSGKEVAIPTLGGVLGRAVAAPMSNQVIGQTTQQSLPGPKLSAQGAPMTPERMVTMNPPAAGPTNQQPVTRQQALVPPGTAVPSTVQAPYGTPKRISFLPNGAPFSIGEQFANPMPTSTSAEAPTNVEVNEEGQPMLPQPEIPEGVPSDYLVQGLAAGPEPIGDMYAGFRGVPAENFRVMSPEVQGNLVKNVIDAAQQMNVARANANEAYKNRIAAYKAPADVAQSIQTARKNMYDADLQQYINTFRGGPLEYERRKSIAGKAGDVWAEGKKWADQVAIADGQPIINRDLRALFPREKTMGDIYRALGPKSAELINSLLDYNSSLYSSSSQAMALQKTILPNLISNARMAMEDNQKRLYELASRYIKLPEGTPDTAENRIRALMGLRTGTGVETNAIVAERDRMISEYARSKRTYDGISNEAYRLGGLNVPTTPSVADTFGDMESLKKAYKAGKVKVGEAYNLGGVITIFRGVKDGKLKFD